MHAGHLDIQRVHRRGLPTDALLAKADEYVEKFPDLVSAEQAKAIMDVIRAERGDVGIANDAVLGADDAEGERPGLSRRLNREEMEALLAKRIDQMKDGGTADAPTDQYRVFSYIVGQLEHGNRPLRLMVQASAGAPFLLLVVVAGRACAPRLRAPRACCQWARGATELMMTTVYGEELPSDQCGCGAAAS